MNLAGWGQVIVVSVGLLFIVAGLVSLWVDKAGTTAGLNALNRINISGPAWLVLLAGGAALVCVGLLWFGVDTATHGGVGDDSGLDRLADACDGGDMAACDELFFAAPVGSELEEFGATCGGRTVTELLCVDAFP